MINLLYKELRLTIHPLFYVFPLFGALLLIPQWPYFIALMYFFFIAVPNIFMSARAQNDIGFTASLPVARGDIVKARFLSIVLLELMQIAVAAAFGALNLAIYPGGNFLLDSNAAFFGFVFVMYGIGNLIVFPLFFKTACKIGGPALLASLALVLFAVMVETAVQLVPALRVLDGTGHAPEQLAVLAAGAAVFALLNALALRVSVRNFERVNI